MDSSEKAIYVVGTADTKGEELRFLADLVRRDFGKTILVDVGTRQATTKVDISADRVAACHPDGASAVLQTDDRGTAVEAMGIAFSLFLASRSDVAGIIGIGGGGGTSVVCGGMRQLALGIPKIMVSTLASGDVSPYVDISDIAMMPSITDMAGLNNLSRMILHNAAQAMCGMAAHPSPAHDDKTSIGLTMFGVTTPCVTRISETLRDKFDCLVFHATGTGGRSMEKLADDGMLAGIIDITTTEICDLLFGGVLPASQDRLGAVARTRLPYVGSVGALDMVNFWAPQTLPESAKGHTIYRHNPNVTLMRTNQDECRQIGKWIGDKLNQCEGQVRFLIPQKGVSALDIEGGEFYDPQADLALFDAIETATLTSDRRRIVRLPYHINDPEFAAHAVETFLEISKQ